MASYVSKRAIKLSDTFNKTSCFIQHSALLLMKLANHEHKILICLWSHENPHTLWNLKVHYHIHKSLPLAPILSHINPVQALLPHFYMTHVNIILLSMPDLLSGLFTLVSHLFSPYIPQPCPYHPSLFNQPNNIKQEVHIMKLCSVQLPQLPHYILPLRPRYIPQNLILMNALNMCSSLKVRGQCFITV